MPASSGLGTSSSGRLSGYLGRAKFYASMLGVDRARRAGFAREFSRSSRLFRGLRTRLGDAYRGDAAGLGAGLRGASFAERLLTLWGPSLANQELYLLVRSARPPVVVETGVASGISSTIILEALRRNGAGRLYSIDLPSRGSEGYLNSDGQREGVFLAAERAPGWLVPEELRSNWELLLGRSQEQLLPLLERLGEVGLFFHDSEHSTDTMRFEFESAWPHLFAGGFLYADDVTWNSAFATFAAGVAPHASGGITPARRGLLRRRSPA
ncbi:MAG: class I SAM-dependent methyltransferase [Thermoplasmata archaeon]|nr:class I SAM-dependent methyltransferase [Thermoplasmata archaeon]